MNTFTYIEQGEGYTDVYSFDIDGYLNPKHVDTITIVDTTVVAVTLKNGTRIELKGNTE